ncbi:MAG TPA: hypothetical protein VLB86_10445 [Gaiellaceae bacterium]|nr:hypothetical protein [Gaiellaceae bacterium]
MPVDVVTEIEIGRPRDEGAAYAADPGNAASLVRGGPAGCSKPAGPIMAAAMRHANGKDLERLEALLERR